LAFQVSRFTTSRVGARGSRIRLSGAKTPQNIQKPYFSKVESESRIQIRLSENSIQKRALGDGAFWQFSKFGWRFKTPFKFQAFNRFDFAGGEEANRGCRSIDRFKEKVTME
jgi:hypothetical protein